MHLKYTRPYKRLAKVGRFELCFKNSKEHGEQKLIEDGPLTTMEYINEIVEVSKRVGKELGLDPNIIENMILLKYIPTISAPLREIIEIKDDDIEWLLDRFGIDDIQSGSNKIPVNKLRDGLKSDLEGELIENVERILSPVYEWEEFMGIGDGSEILRKINEGNSELLQLHRVFLSLGITHHDRIVSLMEDMLEFAVKYRTYEFEGPFVEIARELKLELNLMKLGKMEDYGKYLEVIKRMATNYGLNESKIALLINDLAFIDFETLI